MALEDFDRVLGNFQARQALARGDFVQEVFREQTHVLDALAQWRELNAHHVQAIEKVFPELFLSHLLFEVFVCCRHDADVGFERCGAAYPRVLALLKHAKDLALELERHVADFIQKKSSAIALLEPAGPLSDGAGERALFMAEELALEQLLRDRGAIDGHKAFVRALRIVVHRPRDEFLSRTALACDHHWRVRHGDASDHFEYLRHRFGFSHKRILMFIDGELWFRGGRRFHLRLGAESSVHHGFEGEGEALFADKIKGSQSHGFDHRLGGAEGACEDDDRVRGALADSTQQLHSAEWRQVRLCHQDVRLFAHEDAVGLLRIRGCDDFGFRRRELMGCPIKKVRVRVCDEDELLSGHGMMPPVECERASRGAGGRLR